MPLELGTTLISTGFSLNTTNSNLFFLFCPWTLETLTQQLKVIITRIDFTLKRQFRLRLQAHPEGEPLLSKFNTLTKFHGHFASSIAAIQHYHDFPEFGFPEVDLTVLNSLLTDAVVNQSS